jgi:predicted nucleic acid-binding protein
MDTGEGLMDILIDTSVLLAVIAEQPPKARLIVATEGASLVAPFAAHWQLGQALSMLLQQTKITLEQALRAVAIYQAIPITLVDVELDDALRLADLLGAEFDDATMIQCAIEHDLPLLTLDTALADLARRAGVQVLEVAS